MEKLIFPLYLLPPVSFFQALMKHDEVYISLGEPFKKQTLRSRFEIMSPNKRHTLSIPMKKGKTNCTMEEARISYDENWQRKHWQAITTAYDSSPFFEFLDYELKPLFMDQPVYLHEYNLSLLKWCMSKMKMDTRLKFTEEMPNSEAFIAGQKTFEYDQVFMEKHGFMPNLSVLDWLFNVGV
jgi:hypothetical protein